MKKKILAMFLSLCMAIGLLPMGAMAAEDENAPVTTGNECTGGNCTHVAGIGNTHFDTLQDAIGTANNGETVTLLKGISLTSSITMSNGTEVTLNLNTYDITCNNGTSAMFQITNGTLNVTGEGTITSAQGDVFSVKGNTSANSNTPTNAMLRIGKDVTVNALWNCIWIAGNGAVADIYGSLSSTGEYAVIQGNGTVNGTTNNGGTVVNIYDGASVVHNGSDENHIAIYQPQAGTLNISGGTILSNQNGSTAIEVRAGALNISGNPVITGGSGDPSSTSNGNGSTTSNTAVAVAQHSTKLPISVNITGGTLTGGAALYESNPQSNQENPENPVTITVQNATLNGGLSLNGFGDIGVTNSTVTGDVTKGESASGSLGFVNSTITGKAPTDANSGIVYVNTLVNGQNQNTETINNEALLNGVPYDTLANAINAAEDGGTITLLKNATLKDANYFINGKIVIEGNNKIITATPASGQRSKVFTINNSGELILNNVTLNMTGTKNSDGEKEGDGINVRYGAKLTLNHSTVTFTDMFAPTVFEATPGITILGKVTVNDSSILATGTRGNFSNGGDWTVQNESTVSIIDCGFHGLSVEKLHVNASGVMVNGAQWVGIYASEISLENSANVSVMNCATDENISNTYKNKGAVQLKHVDGTTPSLTIKDNVILFLDRNGNADNGQQVVYVGDGTLVYDGTSYVSATIKTNENQEVYHTVTYVNNGTTINSVLVKNGEEAILPGGPNNSDSNYVFIGWRTGNTTYQPGDTVMISSDTTFTAVWNHIPPVNPDPTYKITIGAMENGTVTANPTAAKAGATVTLTPVPDEGYALSTLTVTDRFGNAVRVTEQADGTYTFPMPNGQVTVTATFVETEAPVDEPFVDVAEGDWFYDAVVYAYQNELMDGVGGNRFAPNSETTRAQLVTILYRLEGEPAVSGDLPFTDVESGTWYTDAILWAAQNNIVNGVSDTEFAPGDDLTRQQLVTILYRYAEAKGYDVSASADLSGYPDADQVQDYAQPAMAWAVAENIIQGMEDGTLKPAGNASRAQIATILMRFCEDVAQ